MTPERWRQVEEIYQSAVDCDPESRAAQVAAACGADEDLRREVESLLSLHSSSVLVDQPAWQTGAELLDNDSIVAAGTQLGPYRIDSLLGEGGMGQVYRAHDTRLARDVAIKIAREEFGERFSREARAVAALNHPNICTLFDVGPNYFVMELVDGSTLAERIKQGPIPLEEALAIAHQIGDALEAAHERGIIHRDLKPGNIKIKPDGTVKVLDFGLAKRQAADPISTDNPEHSPTISLAATRAGVMLGTAAYMSPEQARGKPVNKRSDIWAFGVVLYEMLAGCQLFEGPTITDTIAAVLTKEPDWDAVPAQTRSLLRACLERDPKRRLRDIGDAWRFLDQEVALPRGNRKLIAITVAAISVLSVVAVWGWWRPALVPAPDRRLMRLDVDLGDVSLGAAHGPDVAVSPDGTRLVFVAQNRLFTRRLDQSENTELAGTDGASQPFFSPDGQSVAFFAQDKLKRISVEGGGATVICNASNGPQGGFWSENGTIVAALNPISGLVQIPAAGGAPAELTDLDRGKGEVTHRWPQVLPGGKAVLFTAHKAQSSGFDEASIEVMTLQDRRRTTLHAGGTFGRYLPGGHLIYVNRGALYAVPFDAAGLAVRGGPVRVLEPVGYSTRSGFGQFDWSRSGTAVYRTWASDGPTKTYWLYPSGKTELLSIEGGAVSPDGRRIAHQVSDGASREVWIYDLDSQRDTKLTYGGGSRTLCTWSPDGRYVILWATGGIYYIRSDAPGQPVLLMKSDRPEYGWSFSPDGRQLLVQRGAGDADLWTLPVTSEAGGLHAGTPQPFLSTPFAERFAKISPDGQWVAYESNQSGTSQIYVTSFPHPGRVWQVSTTGGVIPKWSRKHELYYSTEDGRLMVSGYRVDGDTFNPEQPHRWSEVKLTNPFTGPNFDVAPDNNRILTVLPAKGEEPPNSRNHVIFLENFFDELRRRAPGGK